jgi:hypothetical protein
LPWSQSIQFKVPSGAWLIDNVPAFGVEMDDAWVEFDVGAALRAGVSAFV